eukprot:1159557-Pelagomonas_calceolata.AAC.5
MEGVAECVECRPAHMETSAGSGASRPKASGDWGDQLKDRPAQLHLLSTLRGYQVCRTSTPAVKLT